MPRTSRARTGAGRALAASAEADPHARVSKIKQRIKTLEARDAELAERQARIERERAEVDAAIEQAEAELEAAVAAPVVGGDDPTLWLPDELLFLVLAQVGFTKDCTAVCRRWWRLCHDRRLQNEAWFARWPVYAEGEREPQTLDLMRFHCTVLYSDGKGKMYCGMNEGTITVRADTDGKLVRIIFGLRPVRAITVGSDGTLYSAGDDTTIQMWSKESGPGQLIRTMEGHEEPVHALAVNDTNIFSGGEDDTIRVWQLSTGHLVRTLRNVGGWVCSLALGKHGQLYSGSEENVIRVWSATDYTPLRLLEGHTSSVGALTVGRDDTLYSGSDDGIIRVWSGLDGALIQTIDTGERVVEFLALAPNGTLFSACNRSIRMWPTGGRPAIVVPLNATVHGVAFTKDGRLWVAHESIHVF